MDGKDGFFLGMYLYFSSDIFLNVVVDHVLCSLFLTLSYKSRFRDFFLLISAFL